MSAPLKIWSVISYLTDISVEWRPDDWTARNIIKGVKGEPFNGYFWITVGGQSLKFDQTNVANFMPPLFRTVGAKLGELVQGDFDLIPIPNSAATIADQADFNTLIHARAVAAAIGSRARVLPALRWKEQKAKAHEGGSRNPQVLFDLLQVVTKPTRPVVIFDDVMTTGGQMIACYRRLKEAGAAPAMGIVAGRATKEQKVPALAWREEEIETEETRFNIDDIF